MKDKLKYLFFGILIGISNAIPGFSGGTMGVILNIYDRILDIFGNIFTHPLRIIKESWSLIVGIVIGLIGGLIGIVRLLEYYPILINAFFIGLILGTLPTIFGKIRGKQITIIDVMIFVFCISLIIVLPIISSLRPEGNVNIKIDFFQIIMLFIAGVLALAVMVIPGASGSLTLVAIGYYSFVAGTLLTGVKAILNADFRLFAEKALIMFPFVIGAIVGLVGISRLLKKVMINHEKSLNVGVLGLLGASPFAIIYIMINDIKSNEVIQNHISEHLVFNIVGGIFFLFLGIMLIVLSNRVLNNYKKNNLE